jgi:branched-chain amino acid transport system ATP-binding protein/branched-chain amino acid transport system permease protein
MISGRARSFLAIVGMTVFLFVFPFALQALGGGITLASRILVLAFFGLGVDLLFGFTGLLSFGQAAFYGTGGFVAGYLMIQHIVPSTLGALAIGTAVAMLTGLIIGVLALRQVGVYFAMLTLAFGQMFFFLENSPLRNLTGGENGLPGVPRPSILGLHFGTNHSVYVFIAIAYLIGYIVMRRVVGSPFGHVLRAILHNPTRAAATGHDVFRYKLVAFTIAAAYAGLAGGLLGVFQGYLPPDMFTIDQSGQIIVMEVIGGPGTLVGPLIGAIVWIYLSQVLQNFSAVGGLWKLILGLVFILLITGFRRGIAGGVLTFVSQWRYSKRAA